MTNVSVAYPAPTPVTGSKQYEQGIKYPWGWYTEKSTPTWYYPFYSTSNKQGSGGPRIHNSWGWWAPVRDYYRDGYVISVEGNYMLVADSSSLDTATRYQSWSGEPAHFNQFTKVNELFNTSPPSWATGNGFPVLSTNLKNQLITQTLVKFGDRQASLGEALAESGETLKMLASSAIKLAKALRQLKRGNPAGFLKELGISAKPKKVANHWLEYQFGWLPLMSDIYDLHKVAQDGFKQRVKGQLISHVRNISLNDEIKIGTEHFTGDGQVHGKARCKLFYRVSDTTLNPLSQLGLINPLEVAWELVPWSFAIDWLVPVGSFLEATTATMGLDYVDGYVSLTSGHNINADVRLSPSYPYKLAGSMKFHVRSTGFRRQRVSVEDAVPRLFYKSPFSTTHVLDAIALIHNLRR